MFESLDGTIRPMINRDAVSLIFDEPTGIQTLKTDEGKVAQILRNFLTNAVKFTERGEIRVSAQQGTGDAVIFSVKDSGIGIAPENLNRVFEDFGQIDNPMQDRVKGTGLGLPLTRKLAQLLGGTVSVRSEPGLGSTFFAEIPRVFGREALPEVGRGLPPEIDLARAPAVVERDPLSKVMIVDDGERDRYLIKSTLAALGQFDVIEADRGEEALVRARSEKPDVIFLDLILPDMTGFEILDRLKSEVATRDIPVIINTSCVLDEEERGHLVEESVAILAKENKSREEAIAQLRDSLAMAGLRPANHR